MTIESTVTLTPDQADAIGRLLLAIAASQAEGHNLHTVGVTTALDMTNVSNIREVGDALLALGNDTDAIIAPAVPEPAFKTSRTVADVEDMPLYVREHIEEQERISQIFEETFGKVAHEETDLDEIPDVYVSEILIDGHNYGWTFRAVYESDEVIQNFEHLEDGIREHSGSIFYFTEPEADRFEVRVRTREPDVHDYQVYDNFEGRFCDGVFAEELAAEAWAGTLARAEGVPECDISPKSVLEIEPLYAGLVGEFLREIHRVKYKDLYDRVRSLMSKVPIEQRVEIGDALHELSGDPSVMIVQKELEL
jgi:hypothetical protein